MRPGPEARVDVCEIQQEGRRGAEVVAERVFVGLANFQALLSDGVFWQVTRNTIVYTIGA